MNKNNDTEVKLWLWQKEYWFIWIVILRRDRITIIMHAFNLMDWYVEDYIKYHHLINCCDKNKPPYFLYVDRTFIVHGFVGKAY